MAVTDAYWIRSNRHDRRLRHERLTFKSDAGLRSKRSRRATEPTFATAPHSEPRDWGYVGLLAFTAVLLLRPQDQSRFSNPLHLAEVCALVGLGPMLLHGSARRLPVFRVTPETIGLIVFGLSSSFTVPFSIWPGGALDEFTDSYLKTSWSFVLMMNTLTTPKRLEQLTWLIVRLHRLHRRAGRVRLRARHQPGRGRPSGGRRSAASSATRTTSR